MQETPRTHPQPVSAFGYMVAWMLAAAAGLHVLSLLGVVPVDDDYIVYRYARNWVEHGVYAFNLSEGPTDGVTTPLWFLIAAMGVALGVAPELWSLAWGGAAMVLTVLLMGRVGRHLLPASWAWLPAALFALSPAAAWHARAGLGTLPMALALAFALDRLVACRDGRVRPWQVGGALAVAVLFRLEGALVVLGAAVALRRSMTTFWPAIALPAIAMALVCTWRWAAFGHLLPASGALKALPLAHELQYGSKYLVRSMVEGGAALWLMVSAVAMCSRSMSRFEPKDDPPRDHAGGHPRSPDGGSSAGSIRAFLGWSSALALAFVLVVGGDWMVYSRLMVPFLPLALVGACLGLARWRGVDALRWVGAAALLVGTAWGFAARPQAVFENRFFERWWLDVGSALKGRAAPGAKIALSPIGAIGWASELPIVDILGLTHGAFLDLPPDLEGVGVKGHHRHSADWVFEQRPDYIVLGNGVVQPGTGQVSVNPWEADIVLDPRFQAAYVQERCVMERAGGGTGVLPYLRLQASPRLP